VDRRTDIFSFGILAYELLTLRKPFRGEHLSTVLYKILNETPEPVASLAPDVPAPLAAVVERAMEKSPGRRQPSMGVLRQELQAVYRDLTGSPDFEPPWRPAEGARTSSQTGLDLDATLPTPVRGVPSAGAITPPSGALARAPARSDPTPSSRVGPSASLELVNFRNPAEAAGDATLAGPSRAAQPAAPPRRGARIAIAAGLVVLAGLGAAAVYIAQSGARTSRAEPARPAPTSAPAPAEFPEPRLGEDPKTEAPVSPAVAETSRKPDAQATAGPAPEQARRLPIQFSSIPMATVFVDGRSVGSSLPARTVELPQGKHRVRFEGPGLPPFEKEFLVGPGQAARVHHQFPVGLLLIQADGSWQGASVIVDGKYRGSLPETARLTLPAGTYSLTLHREGWKPATERIEIGERSQKVWTPPAAVPVESGGGP
jgi:serine/threonine-protein kinase